MEICISLSQAGRNLDRIIRASLVRVSLCVLFFFPSPCVGDAAARLLISFRSASHFFSVCGGNTWNMTHTYNTISGKCNVSRLWLISQPRAREENKQTHGGWLHAGARSTPHFKPPRKRVPWHDRSPARLHIFWFSPNTELLVTLNLNMSLV